RPSPEVPRDLPVFDLAVDQKAGSDDRIRFRRAAQRHAEFRLDTDDLRYGHRVILPVRQRPHAVESEVLTRCDAFDLPAAGVAVALVHDGADVDDALALLAGDL